MKFKMIARIKQHDITTFIRQLSTMLDTGIPLSQACLAYSKGQENQLLSDLAIDIQAKLLNGLSLSDALRSHPMYFSHLTCNLIDVGEKTGALSAILIKIADYQEKTQLLKAKLIKALLYPCITLFTAAVISCALMIFVIPQFESLFISYQASLPIFTQFILTISSIVKGYWWLLVIGVISFVSLFKWLYNRGNGFKQWWDKKLLTTPIFGKILLNSMLVRSSETLAICVNTGIALTEALNISSKLSSNHAFCEAFSRVFSHVESGQELHQALKKQSIFPQQFIQLVAIGEESGELANMLIKTAEMYEQRMNMTIDTLRNLLEPMIMLILGTIIGSLVIAMYLPIFKLGTIF